MSIGKRIKEFAKKEHGTVGRLASKMGIASSQLSQYTSGARKPSADILAKLAKLGADINYILTGERNVSKEDIEELRAIVEKNQSELTRLKARLFDLEEENRAKESKISELETENNKLRAEIGALAALNGKAKREGNVK